VNIINVDLIKKMNAICTVYVPFHLRSVFLIVFATLFSLQLLAQKNSDGSYTIKNREGKFVTYFPQHPGNSNYVIDTLAVGKSDLYFRLSDKKRMELRKPEGSSAGDLSNSDQSERKTMYPDGSIGTQYSSYPPCDCVVDTMLIELPDGSFKQFFTVQDPKNTLVKHTVQSGKQKNTIEVYENAAFMPVFFNGANDLRSYINSHVRTNIVKNYSEVLQLKLVVLSDGNIGDVEFEPAGGNYPPELEKELIRVLKNMPLWKPAVVDGKAVSAFYHLKMMLTI